MPGDHHTPWILAGEKETLVDFLDYLRGAVIRRVAGATRTDVRRALWADRTLVKTFGPRGTVHLLPAADLPRLASWPWSWRRRRC